MRRSFTVGVIALVAASPLGAQTWDPRALRETPESIVLQTATADYAVISGFGRGNQYWKRTIAVRDHGWIRSIAQQLHGTSFERMENILDITTTVTFYDRSGEMLHELELFPSRARLDGADYRVDAITANTVGEMIKIHLANDPIDPVPTPTGPPSR